MAKQYAGRSNSYGRRSGSGGGASGRKSEKGAQLTRLAYDMGQVERGLKNPESRISAAHAAGKKPVEHKKKSLF